MTRPLMINKTFRLREDVVEQLSKAAQENETSEAAIVRNALNYYFDSMHVLGLREDWPQPKYKGFGAWKREVSA